MHIWIQREAQWAWTVSELTQHPWTGLRILCNRHVFHSTQVNLENIPWSAEVYPGFLVPMAKLWCLQHRDVIGAHVLQLLSLLQSSWSSSIHSAASQKSACNWMNAFQLLSPQEAVRSHVILAADGVKSPYQQLAKWVHMIGCRSPEFPQGKSMAFMMSCI